MPKSSESAFQRKRTNTRAIQAYCRQFTITERRERTNLIFNYYHTTQHQHYISIIGTLAEDYTPEPRYVQRPDRRYTEF